ncbi:MAG: TonB-dependent receptor [Deltaproteobacteria bacterium]|nr:TonB-dependent receptor [Deltaproteobacteria bacterium]
MRTSLLLGAGLVLALATLHPTQATAQQPESGITPPVVKSQVAAALPAGQSPAQDEEAILAVLVDATGHVTSAQVVQSAGKVEDEAARVAALQWVFLPAVRDGRPVPSKVRLSFHFPAASAAPTPPVVKATAGPKSQSPVLASDVAKPAETESSRVTIVGHARPPSRGASDFHFRIGALSLVPRANASELLKLAPGILLSNTGGDGHPEQVFLRGFDAREGQDIEFTVGGVPINEAGNPHGNGVSDTHFIIPELVHSLRVVEGPFDPRQGNFAVAGSADYELGLDQRGASARYTIGSFNTQRLVLLWGPEQAPTGTFAGAEIFSTDGFGQNRDARRATMMGQYEGRLGDRGSWRVTAQGYSAHYHSAGLLREDDYRSGRKGFYDTYDPRQGGDSSRFSLAAEVEDRWGDTVLKQSAFFIDRSMRLQENFTGFLLDPQLPSQSLHGQRGDLLDLDVSENTLGARGMVRHRASLLGQVQALELGYFARTDHVDGTQHRIENLTGTPYRLQNSLESRMVDLGLYADANVAMGRYVRLTGGIRTDLLTFDVLNRCPAVAGSGPDAGCDPQASQGQSQAVRRASTASSALLPRASLILGPFDHFSFNASYGEGIRSIDPIYVSQDAATPFASIRAYEGAAAYAGSLGPYGLVVRSVFFQTRVDRDLVFSEVAGRGVLGGATTRTGWMGAARLNGSWFDQAAHVTAVKATFDDTHHLVPYVPQVVVRSDSVIKGDLPLRIGGRKVRGAIGAGVSFVGARPLPYGERGDRVLALDASGVLSWRMVELGLIGTNLTDQMFRLGEYNYVSDFHSQGEPTRVPSRHFSAGAPRAVFLTVALRLGDES